jgi:hypothetical protein
MSHTTRRRSRSHWTPSKKAAVERALMPIRSSHCGKKVAHPSKAVASGVIRVMAQKDKGHGLSPYKCAVCRAWHIGHAHRRAAVKR